MIVGASIAGCAAAIMYAQQGLRIALLDARSDIRAHKVLCTHHLQPCGAPILQRLGATENCSPWEWWKPFRHSGPLGE
ncbi:NAD(P)/FAD-dependent oxidoreductase [Rhodococcus sp. 3Y1]